MKSLYVLFVLTFSLTLPNESHANSSFDHIERSDHGGERFERSPAPIQNEKISATGWVKCKEGSHYSVGDCDLVFIREKDNKVFDIEDSPELLKEHCKTHSDLKVSISGEITSKFLFWGGDLIVDNFKIEDKGADGVCIAMLKSEQTERNNRRIEREMDRGGKI